MNRAAEVNPVYMAYRFRMVYPLGSCPAVVTNLRRALADVHEWTGPPDPNVPDKNNLWRQATSGWTAELQPPDKKAGQCAPGRKSTVPILLPATDSGAGACSGWATAHGTEAGGASGARQSSLVNGMQPLRKRRRLGGLENEDC